MFPQITKKKKKDYVINDNILKEWEQISHELDGRSKLALKKIPNQLLHDFSKVCRIKSIPEFYANYFIYFIQKANQKQQQLAFSDTIQNLLTHRSYFHIINDILKQREEIIVNIRDSLLIVEGFIVMNQGKNVSLNAKGVIDELVKGCESLEKLKELQKRKTQQLVRNIIKARSNTVSLIQKVLQWRKYLENLGKTQINAKNAIKVIYPHQAINCLLLPFYDIIFIKNSTLKAQINFGKDEEDPFLLKLTKSKKGSQIQEYFFDELKSDTFNYNDYENILKQQLPNEQSSQQRQREFLKQKLIEKTKLEKIKEENLREEKLKKMKEEKSKQMRIRHFSSSKDLKDIKQKKDQLIDRGIGYRTSRGDRSEKKIINVDALLKVSAHPVKNGKRQKSILMNGSKVQILQKESKQKQMQTWEQRKIFEVYNKSKRKKSIIDMSLASQKQQEKNGDKQKWDNHFKEEKLQRQKIQRLLKQTEKKANQQAKQFEQKIKKYEEQIENLKRRGEGVNKKMKRPTSSSQQKRNSPIKQLRQSVMSVYSSSVKPKQQNVSLLSSRLDQESRAKKNLQIQINELGKQKRKLQKMLEKQSMKLSSEGEGYHKKIQKYEQIITNLKNQSQQNKKLIKEIQIKKNLQQKQKVDNLRMYAVKEKQEEFKKKVQAKVQQRQNRKKSRSLRIQQEAQQKQIKKQQIKLQNKSRIISQKSLDKSTNLIQPRLEQESREKKNLEMQINELVKQKRRLQKMLQKQSMKLSSQGETYHKKIQKYEQIITNLKNQSQQNKKIIKEIQRKKDLQQKQKASSLRMYTVKEKQEEFKKKIKADVQQRQNRKKARALRIQQEARQKQIKKQQIQLQNKSRIKSQKSLDRSANLSHQDVEIIKTTQTIEIVFEAKNRKTKVDDNKKQQLITLDSRMINLQKQRQLLSKKLQLSLAGKQDKKKLYESKIQEKDLRMDRFKEEIKKQRERNAKLQQNIKQMKHSINNQIDLKLHKEKIKFQQQREELLSIIQQERQEKFNKDKYLDQQMKFLKEMEKKEIELIDLLDQEKKQKREKERILVQELKKKEELMNLMTIEEIKKNIEREVRKQLLQSDEEDQEDIFLKEERMKIEQQIQNLKLTKYEEINDMDQQNQKLKQLISRIKGQQTKLLEAIKQNIELESDPEQMHVVDVHNTEHISENDKVQEQKSYLPDQSDVNIQVDKSVLLQQLQHKTDLQFKSEEKKRQNYAHIGNSSHYKQKEKIQNLVQFYLQGPNHLNEDHSPQINAKQKKQIVDKVTRNSQLVQSFQKQLFALKKLPDFVPSVKNNPINSHLLNLREVYDEYEADSLRRELFPPLEDEVYNQNELSVQNEELPIVTLMDEVNDHAKRHSQKKDDKKNFLAINRMRLMLLQDDKKEKQRKIIEQQSKRKIQRQLLQKKRKQRERQIEKERQSLLQKQKQKYRNKERQRKRIKINKQQQPNLQSKQEAIQNISKAIDGKQANQIRQIVINPTLSIRISSNNHQITNLEMVPTPLKDQHSPKKQKETQQIQSTLPPRPLMVQTDSELIPSQKQEEDGEDYLQDFEDKDSMKQQNEPEILIQQQQLKQQKEKTKDVVLPIPEEPVQQKVQQKKQIEEQKQQSKEDLQQKERTALKQQVLSLQEQVRSFIDGEQHYEVYQQFIPAEEAGNRVQQILDLSSAEIINLNGNSTLKGDISLYSTIGLLIAKDMKGIQVGIGIYHKQFQTGQYVCDYLVSHNMLNFLNLVFNLSRFIFKNDKSIDKIQYIFNLQHIQERQTLLHFLQFQKKCKRLGQVYVKSLNLKERKYVLRRALFEEVKEEVQNSSKGIQFKLKLQVYEDLLQQVDLGFTNTCNVNYGSISIILAYYLSKNQSKFALFRQKFEHELYYQEMLVTALLFKKKEIQIKNFTYSELGGKQKSEHLSQLQQKFDMTAINGNIGQMKLQLGQKLPISLKRCILTVGYEEINYIAYTPEEAVTRIQSSNSSETGIFLGILPKYKLLIMEAEEFLTMSQKNTDLTAFFYIKHFIKNLIDVKKEVYQKIYIPEVAEDDLSYFSGMSSKIKNSLFLEENIRLGWKKSFGNSLIFKPKHSDLVIQKPFIMALLSGAVERAVEGSPICVKLII